MSDPRQGSRNGKKPIRRDSIRESSTRDHARDGGQASDPTRGYLPFTDRSLNFHYIQGSADQRRSTRSIEAQRIPGGPDAAFPSQQTIPASHAPSNHQARQTNTSHPNPAVNDHLLEHNSRSLVQSHGWPTDYSQRRSSSKQPEAEPNRRSNQLSPSYFKRPPSFFVPGRVFSTLWSEPVGSPTGKDARAYSENWYREWVYSKIRRFVVIHRGHNHCMAAPILSYDQQGVVSAHIKKSDHVIIHTGIEPAPLALERSQAGLPGMLTPSIKVIPDQPEQYLKQPSRLNLAKLHPIEYNIKVSSVGMVHQASLADLLRHSQAIWIELSQPSQLAQNQPYSARNPRLGSFRTEHASTSDYRPSVATATTAPTPGKGNLQIPFAQTSLDDSARSGAQSLPNHLSSLPDVQTSSASLPGQRGAQSISDRGRSMRNAFDNALKDGCSQHQAFEMLVGRLKRLDSSLADRSAREQVYHALNPTSIASQPDSVSTRRNPTVLQEQDLHEDRRDNESSYEEKSEEDE